MKTTPGKADLQLGAQTPAPTVPSSIAPTVRPIPAQGTALGSREREIQALKGRPKTAFRVIAPTRKYVAPSGLHFVLPASPGALPRAGIFCPVGARELPCGNSPHDLEEGTP